MKIAIASSIYQSKWENVELSWEDFCKKFSKEKIVIKPIKMEEYLSKNKVQRSKIKDVGGYVAGSLQYGIRKPKYVLTRSALVFEIDNTSHDFEHYVKIMKYYTCIIHTTCSHTQDNPHLRIILPLKNEIKGSLYEPLFLYVSDMLGTQKEVDSTGTQVNRLMYWPCIMQDAEYRVEFIQEEYFDPAPILKQNPDWGNKLINLTEDKLDAVKTAKKRYLQKDPRQKNGVIKAFCSAYDIYECIETFIPEYIPTDIPDRYTWANGSSYGGVLTFENTFSYSFHATDPACNRLSSAFDLIRIHKFNGDLKKTIEFCAAQNKVADYLAIEEFGDTLEDWHKNLTRDKNGCISATLNNIINIVKNDNMAFRFNEFTNQMYLFINNREIKPYKEEHLYMLMQNIENKYKIFNVNKTEMAIKLTAAENVYNPVVDYLSALPDWDGVNRIDMLLIDYFSAEDTQYNREVTRKTLIAAVKRAFEPGCDWRTVLVLSGKQHIGKSTFFRNLVPVKKWFSDSFNLIQSREVKLVGEQLEGVWIMEISELAGMGKAESDAVKSMISRQSDRYRAAWGKGTEDYPRRSIFVGTVNNQFLKDITGNSRYKIIKCGKRTRDTIERDKIWAEALYYYKAGESLSFSAKVLEASEEIELEHFETDERRDLVLKYLETNIPENWYTDYNINQRKNFFSNEFIIDEDDIVNKKRVNFIKRKWTSAMEIWCECFQRAPYELDQRSSAAINKILHSLGYTQQSIASDAVYGLNNVNKKRKVLKKKEEE